MSTAKKLPANATPQERLRQMVRPLLRWFAAQARDLPWRADADPYRVWISEIMLQQTRVEAVRPYYARFLAELPDVRALATVDEERLLKLWEGLGYYSRARNLQKAARMLVSEYDGVFPRTREGLLALPGIGDYTAGALASICFDLPEPAVDGNVLRVIARLCADRTDIRLPARKAEVAALLRPVYPPRRCGDFTQALMELGAMVCLPGGAPLCAVCPLRTLCRSKQEGCTGEIPVRSQPRPRRIEPHTVFLLRCEGRIALRKRPARGLLAGLWELPNVAGHLNAAAARAQLLAWGISAKSLRETGGAKHIFSHVEWHMRVYYAECKQPAPGFAWVTPQMLAQGYSLPTAFQLPLAAAMEHAAR